MMAYQYSALTNMFYPESELTAYKSNGSIPNDLKPVSDDACEFMGLPPEGKIRGGNAEGMPCWIDIPQPTQEELFAIAERERQRRINATTDYMNSKQWPGKAAMGRLSGVDKAQYNLWLDYHDALEAVDVSTAPDIKWPNSPAG
ncbi:TPA: tail fiber assembly protein [Salmonella enterica]|nr:tail fiber assembly protein [Salmonella enterica]MCH5743058.1 tail fiber assembly protein [Salmonella enterica]MCH5748169.1 tail fiber assembly protein [Salmonella enterica]MCH5756242.1 tail fiber assembly protein [Salmonella enterica]MCH5768299.1 tail fiber assembly protein [Salmonella enterica]